MPERKPSGGTILVVDDDPEVLALARDILAADGYHLAFWFEVAV